eukprot:1157493-Pelagomonas_calceolata.AAC.6
MQEKLAASSKTPFSQQNARFRTGTSSCTYLGCGNRVFKLQIGPLPPIMAWAVRLTKAVCLHTIPLGLLQGRTGTKRAAFQAIELLLNNKGFGKCAFQSGSS